jgi:UDP-N-acetyl-D-glucosamine dehydrogenase
VTRDSRVAVVGLGYVGLPLAIAFAEAGLDVEGIDVSEARVATILSGRSPIDDVTDERLGNALSGGLGAGWSGGQARSQHPARR